MNAMKGRIVTGSLRLETSLEKTCMSASNTTAAVDHSSAGTDPGMCAASSSGCGAVEAVVTEGTLLRVGAAGGSGVKVRLFLKL
jgi:hypothetical protein